MNRERIINDFYVLASDDAGVSGIRYCKLAPIWYDMAVSSERGISEVAVLAEMTRLQREHEGLILASDVMEKLAALEAKIDALQPPKEGA